MITKTLLLPLFVLATLIVATPASAVDLLETYHLAQLHDTVYAAAREAQLAGQEKLVQGRALMLPSVNLTANTTGNDAMLQYRGTNTFISGTSRFNSNGYGISLTQPLFRQQNWVAYTEAELQVTQTDAQFKEAEQDLILRVAQAYFDVLIAQDNLQLAEAQIMIASEQLEQTKRNLDVGTGTTTDIYEAQANHELANAQTIEARSNLELKKHALQQIIDTEPGELRNLGKELNLKVPHSEEIAKWVMDAQQHSLQIVQAQASAELAEKEMERNRAAHYPTLDLMASYTKSSAGSSSLGAGISSENINLAVGVQFNLPLYQGGATQSKFREAEAYRNRAKLNLENTHRNVALQTRQAYLSAVTGISKIKALLQAVKSSEQLLVASKLGQDAGVRNTLDVLNAHQHLLSTRIDLDRAKFNFLINQLRLKAVTGSLVEADLVEINQKLY